jgi:hypothetical protein
MKINHYFIILCVCVCVVCLKTQKCTTKENTGVLFVMLKDTGGGDVGKFFKISNLR